MSKKKKKKPRYKLGPNKKINDRRKKVLRLRFVKRWPVDQIAQVLDVSKRTVERDIEAIAEYGREIGTDVMKEPIEKTVWEIMENYHERQMLRWQEFANTKDTKIRAGILNDISNEDERHYKLLQSMGIVKKAPERLDVREVQSWADIAAMIEAGEDEQNNEGGSKEATEESSE